MLQFQGAQGGAGWVGEDNLAAIYCYALACVMVGISQSFRWGYERHLFRPLSVAGNQHIVYIRTNLIPIQIIFPYKTIVENRQRSLSAA